MNDITLSNKEVKKMKETKSPASRWRRQAGRRKFSFHSWTTVFSAK